MVDLLLGGSPCQGFSFAGKQLNFSDPRSKLFFDFVKALEVLKPKYFLLENVKMKKECENIITQHLGVKPIEINSGLVSAQDRKRLYWTNIPGIQQPKNMHIYLKDILETETTVTKDMVLEKKYLERYQPIKNYKLNQEKSCVIGTLSKYQGDRVFDVNGKGSSLCANGGNNAGGSCNIIWDNNELRKLTPVECERLQTLPDNYTAVGVINGKEIPISNTQRYKMIGNGWTVDVIAHILSFIPEKYLHTVVSLFDGISCGQVALERAGKIYNQYYASEIDKYAIAVTQKNYPHTIQLGDVTKIDWNAFLDRLDLIQNVPCQGSYWG